MPFITFYWNKNFIYSIIFWIFEIFFRLFMYLNWSNFELSENDVQDEYIFMILLYIGDLFSGFLFAYIKCSLKNGNKRENKQADDSNEKVRQYLIYEDREENLSKDYLIKIIIICIINFVARLLFLIAFARTGAEYKEIYHQLQNDICIVIDILMRYILSIFMLRQVIYRHKKFSIVLIIIGFLLIFPADIYCMFDNIEINRIKTSYYILILTISAFTYPIVDTMNKQLFNKYYIIPESLMFHKALIGAIILIIITPILYFSFDVKLSLNIDDWDKILVIIIYTLTSFCKKYILLKIIYYFSSQLVSFLIFSESLGSSISEIIKLVKDENKHADDFILITLEILGIFIILFSSLVYDEVIIINKWKLNENVKIGIINRGELEMKNMNKLDNNPLHLKLTLMGEEDFKKVYDDNENEEK